MLIMVSGKMFEQDISNDENLFYTAVWRESFSIRKLFGLDEGIGDLIWYVPDQLCASSLFHRKVFWILVATDALTKKGILY
jgi:hypothetical protein